MVRMVALINKPLPHTYTCDAYTMRQTSKTYYLQLLPIYHAQYDNIATSTRTAMIQFYTATYWRIGIAFITINHSLWLEYKDYTTSIQDSSEYLTKITYYSYRFIKFFDKYALKFTNSDSRLKAKIRPSTFFVVIMLTNK